MSVSNLQDVEYRHWGAYTDPRMPVGLWTGRGLILGDASGGERQVLLVFNPATAVVLALYFSLEQISIQDSDNVTKTCRLVSEALDPIRGGSNPVRIGIDLVATAGGVEAVTSENGMRAVRGVFLGRQSAVAQTTGLSFLADNVDGATLTFAAQGYVWGARSGSAPEGGLRRPVGGLYP